MSTIIPNYSFYLRWSPEDDSWIATCPEMSWAIGHGDTRWAAVKALEEIVALGLKDMAEHNEVPPEPCFFEQRSGQIRLRMPRRLHALLSEEAEREGVSLNAHLNAIIAERGMGGRSSAFEETLKSLIERIEEQASDLEAVRRLVIAGTSATQDAGSSAIPEYSLLASIKDPVRFLSSDEPRAVRMFPGHPCADEQSNRQENIVQLWELDVREGQLSGTGG